MIRAMRAAMLGAVLALVAGCVTAPDRYSTRSLNTIEADLRAHVTILASDDFAGRRPGSEGERKTLQYLAETWEATGLVSATNDPSNPWLAPLELAVRRPVAHTASFTANGRVVDFDQDQLRIFASGRSAILADAPMIFVGTQGEELDRAALAGRVAIMMWDHKDREEQRAALIASDAAAVIAIVLEPQDFARRVRFREAGTYRLAGDEAGSYIDGYISLSGAVQLIGEQRLSELLRAAEQPGFRPEPLGIDASLEATSLGGALRTHNLIAKLPGRVPDAGAVLLMAHWDHFGICGDPASDDTVCNGAVDNASGLAVLTEIARYLGRGPQLDRDVYFLATTAEEWGLLGATAFARDPPLPLRSIVAAFNLDSVGVAKRGSDVAVVGYGLTLLDPEVDAVIAASGRKKADGSFANRFVRRQDGWALLQRDVPTLMITSALADEAVYSEYETSRYHAASDNIDTIELGGASEDTALHLDLAEHFANITAHPGTAQ